MEVLQDYSLKEGPIDSLNNLDINCYFVWDDEIGIISLVDDVYYPAIHQFSRFIINFNNGHVIQNHTYNKPKQLMRVILKRHKFIENMLIVLNVQEK